MNEKPHPPVPHVIPPPDVPPPTAYPPEPQLGAAPSSASRSTGPAPGTPLVAVKIRNAGDSEVRAGSLAPFNTRILAALIDLIVAVGLLIAVMMILPGIAKTLGTLVAMAYLVARDSLPFLGGQSVGKKAMKLKTVMTDGQSLVEKWEPALIRNGILLIPFFGLVEFIVLLTREDKPGRGIRLGDEWANTKVIIEGKS